MGGHNTPCSVHGCGRIASRKDKLCATHYRYRTLGYPDWATRPIRVQAGPMPCLVPGCAKTSHALGLCNAHYRRKRLGHPRWNDMLKVVRLRGETGVIPGTGLRVPLRDWRMFEAHRHERGLSSYALLSEMVSIWAELRRRKHASRAAAEEREVLNVQDYVRRGVVLDG